MDVRREITNRIIEKISQGGLPPWRAGWVCPELAYNGISKIKYQGVNQLLLGMSGFGDPRWMTFKQARAKGLHVRKGEKATGIVRLVECERKRAEALEGKGEVLAEEKGKFLVLRHYSVFNGAQIEGMESLPARTHTVDRVEAAEGIVEGMKKTGLTVLYGHAGASYSPLTDSVRMPPRTAFLSTADLYGTLLHECAHATGAAHRTGRLIPAARIPTLDYAFEEVVAELGACLSLADIGMGGGLGEHHIASHAAYVGHYLALLQDDSSALFRAAAAAQRAADYMRDHAIVPEPVPLQGLESQSEARPEMQSAHSNSHSFRP